MIESGQLYGHKERDNYMSLYLYILDPVYQNKLAKVIRISNMSEMINVDNKIDYFDHNTIQWFYDLME